MLWRLVNGINLSRSNWDVVTLMSTAGNVSLNFKFKSSCWSVIRFGQNLYEKKNERTKERKHNFQIILVGSKILLKPFIIIEEIQYSQYVRM